MTIDANDQKEMLESIIEQIKDIKSCVRCTEKSYLEKAFKNLLDECFSYLNDAVEEIEADDIAHMRCPKCGGDLFVYQEEDTGTQYYRCHCGWYKEQKGKPMIRKRNKVTVYEEAVEIAETEFSEVIQKVSERFPVTEQFKQALINELFGDEQDNQNEATSAETYPEYDENGKRIGTIESFVAKYGYGFIRSGEQKFFFHINDVDESQKVLIDTDVHVSFYTQYAPKGEKARNVEVID